MEISQLWNFPSYVHKLAFYCPHYLFHHAMLIELRLETVGRTRSWRKEIKDKLGCNCLGYPSASRGKWKRDGYITAHVGRHIAEYTLLLLVLRSTDYAVMRWSPAEAARPAQQKMGDQKAATDRHKIRHRHNIRRPYQCTFVPMSWPYIDFLSFLYKS